VSAKWPGCACNFLLPTQWNRDTLLLVTNMKDSRPRTDVPHGTLGLMVLKTLDVLGPLHGYAIARRIEQISGDLLAVNQGTLYPVLLRLEQEGAIASEWGTSDNNRRARFYRLARGGRKLLQAETRDWEQTTAILSRFFELKAEDLS
jgi:PadR family transcriptional regulator PadR